MPFGAYPAPGVPPVVNTGDSLKTLRHKGVIDRTYEGCEWRTGKEIVMENNNNANNHATGTAAEGTEKATQTGAAAGNNTTPTEETVTMSKADYDKAIQAAEDRLRTKYSKEIKTLQDKITELTPVQKTEAERALEQRLAELERKEKESEEKAKMLSLKDALQTHSLDAGIADYLKTDVDVEAFSAAIEKVAAARLAAQGYKPTGHQTTQPITKAEFDKMSYDQKVELYNRDRETWNRLKH